MYAEANLVVAPNPISAGAVAEMNYDWTKIAERQRNLYRELLAR